VQLTTTGALPLERNIVATVNLGTRLDLKTIAMHARNAEYNPKVRHWQEDFLIPPVLTLSRC
jgi:hypothetical protein